MCENYEITGDGRLSKRKEVEEYDSGLTTAINAVFSSVISIFEPYYPPKLLDEQTNDFLLFVFGETGSGRELHFFYKTEDWTNQFNSEKPECFTHRRYLYFGFRRSNIYWE